MDLLWPWFLLLLLLIPLIIAVYIGLLKRRNRYAVRYPSLSLVREALPKWSRWRRHLPFALFLLGLTSLIAALARPVAAVEVPLSRTTIILALDTSRSMCATDVFPNRLTVAQDAALAFIEDQPAGTQIGIVAFAGFAEIVVSPTRDKDQLQTAIRSFTTSLGTTIGSATLKSIDAIAAINPAVAPSDYILEVEADETPVEEKVYQPDIIVLLTDGANSQGPNPLDAAKQAADRGIRVYTIGFGTSDPGQMICSQQQIGSDTFSGRFGGFGGGFGGGGGGNFRRFVVIDETTLRAVADMTGGTYFRAENADQLLNVFLNLPTQIVLQKESLEISVLFSILGAIFVIAAVTLSLLWHRFP
ncbi:MAG: VWA domain-containing protein [Anaerolineae bacterium]|nr:VWA domain-containing protein [Anaerolineae bacterium]